MYPPTAHVSACVLGNVLEVKERKFLSHSELQNAKHQKGYISSGKQGKDLFYFEREREPFRGAELGEDGSELRECQAGPATNAMITFGDNALFDKRLAHLLRADPVPPAKVFYSEQKCGS